MATALSQTFGIRCPASILSGTDVVKVMDFESNSYGNDALNNTAFCGTGSQYNYLFLTNINTNVQFRYVKKETLLLIYISNLEYILILFYFLKVLFRI